MTLQMFLFCTSMIIFKKPSKLVLKVNRLLLKYWVPLLFCLEFKNILENILARTHLLGFMLKFIDICLKQPGIFHIHMFILLYSVFFQFKITVAALATEEKNQINLAIDFVYHNYKLTNILDHIWAMEALKILL